MLSSIGSRAAADPEELHFRREARSRFVRTFLRYPAALPALILFVIVVLCALGAPLLTQYTPFEGNAAERLQGIGTAGHLLGTDEQGRDILTRCLYGGRLSLLMGFLPVALATIVGSILGIISGYFARPMPRSSCAPWIFSMRSPPFFWPSHCPRFWLGPVQHHHSNRRHSGSAHRPGGRIHRAGYHAGGLY